MTVNASKDWIQELYVKEFMKPKLLPTDFYYDRDGRMVMNESYHIKRGKCCGSGCLHCPYEPRHERGSTNLKESLRK
jgi:hypothetical protein